MAQDPLKRCKHCNKIIFEGTVLDIDGFCSQNCKDWEMLREKLQETIESKEDLSTTSRYFHSYIQEPNKNMELISRLYNKMNFNQSIANLEYYLARVANDQFNRFKRTKQ